MRYDVSIDGSMPGAKVFVDGKKIRHVRSFDISRHWLVKLCEGEKGEGHPENKHLDPHNNNKPCEHLMRGSIRVVWSPE